MQESVVSIIDTNVETSIGRMGRIEAADCLLPTDLANACWCNSPLQAHLDRIAKHPLLHTRMI